MRDAVPGELFEFLEVDDAGVEEGFEAVPSLLGAVVLQVLVGVGLLDLLLAVEDVRHVQLLLHLAPVLLPESPIAYFLKSLKMDIK